MAKTGKVFGRKIKELCVFGKNFYNIKKNLRKRWHKKYVSFFLSGLLLSLKVEGRGSLGGEGKSQGSMRGEVEGSREMAESPEESVVVVWSESWKVKLITLLNLGVICKLPEVLHLKLIDWGHRWWLLRLGWKPGMPWWPLRMIAGMRKSCWCLTDWLAEHPRRRKGWCRGRRHPRTRNSSCPWVKCVSVSPRFREPTDDGIPWFEIDKILYRKYRKCMVFLWHVWNWNIKFIKKTASIKVRKLVKVLFPQPKSLKPKKVAYSCQSFKFKKGGKELLTCDPLNDLDVEKLYCKLRN